MALATVAFAVPAVASAEEPAFWTDEGNTFINERTVTLTGGTKFNTLGTGIECPDSTATVTANTGGHSSTGTVHFKVDLAACEGFGETFEGCTITEIKNTVNGYRSFEYDLTNTGQLIATNVIFDSVFDEECPDSTVKTTFSEVIATPDDSESISSATHSSLNGKAFINGSPFGFPLVTEGELKVQGEDAGTFGIG